MKALTANRLIDGIAIWYAADGTWSETLAGAALAGDAQAEARLEEIGAAAGRDNFAVDINLIDVDLVAGEIVPQRLRERIRAAGPTNRTDLGKQAERSAAA